MTQSSANSQCAHSRRNGSRSGQRGFALLLVLAMAAAAAIFLYMQLPRVAFEAQRDREEMLIQRGKDYQRAIELYVRRNNKYPEQLEDLERQQEMRFLRRRHKDPLTGKDDWRIIRISASGQLEGSLVQKAPQPGSTGTPSVQDLLGDDANVAENTALARQRSGDERAANAEFPGGGARSAQPLDGQQPNPEGAADSQPPAENPLDEGLVPLIDASGNVVQPSMTEAQAQQRQGSGGRPAGQPGATPSGPDTSPNEQQDVNQQGPRLGPGGIPIIENPAEVVAQANAQAQTGTPPAPGLATGPGAPGQPGQTGPGSTGRPPTSGADMIGSILTTPVPGGLQGLQQRRGISAGGTSATQSLGAGIAGVASRFEMRGIKVFAEQESIHKWEFVFDARKQQQSRTNTNTPRRQGSFSGQPGSPSQPPPRSPGR